VKALVAVVDDDEAVRDALGTILVLEGYSVRSYASGGAFMRAAGQRRQADCIVLDLHLADGSGADVLEALDTAATPVLVISAAEWSPEAPAAIYTGLCEFLKKPFDADTILERVKAALRNEPRPGCHQKQLPDHPQK